MFMPALPRRRVQRSCAARFHQNSFGHEGPHDAPRPPRPLRRRLRPLTACAALLAATLTAQAAHAAGVPPPATLQNATATASQDDFGIAEMINGSLSNLGGWAIGNSFSAQIAA
jgi:hypothetical protein